MAFDLDLCAVRDVAKNTVSHHWLMANVANPANLANDNQPNATAKAANLPTKDQSNNPKSSIELATLAKLAGLAISHRPANCEKQAQNPEVAHLMALAMQFCDHIGASDKARTDWQADIEGTPPDLHADLADYLKGRLPSKPHLRRALTAPASTPKPAKQPGYWVLLTTSEAWCKADQAYQLHHFACPQCKAASKSSKGSYGVRCAMGAELQAEYLRAGETATAPIN